MTTTVPPRSAAHGPTLTTLVGGAVVLLGALIGLQPLGDNSFLTHLATGRLILDSGIPSVDPYSATAAGQSWVVQSWLASWLYGTVEAVGGFVGLRILFGATMGALALVVWLLTRPAGGVVARAAIAGGVVLMGAELWSERPLLFGLIGIGLVLLAADDRLAPGWLVPVFWLWVNTHGSFPLGLLTLAVLAAGAWLDARRRGEGGVDVERRALVFAGAGTLLGAVSPVGPKLLTFPIELLSRSSTLAEIQEWQSPDFSELGPRLFAVLAGVALLAVARTGSRRDALLAAFALGLALMAERNVATAALLLVPVVARGAHGLSAVRGDLRPRLGRLVAVPLCLLAALLALSTLRGPDVELRGYPVEEIDWLEEQGLVGEGSTVVSRDFVGNYLTARYGTEAAVFIDDRYDMYPTQLTEDYVALLRGTGWEGILDRYGAEVVLWDRASQLGQLLEASPSWSVLMRDEDWILAVPDDAGARVVPPAP